MVRIFSLIVILIGLSGCVAKPKAYTPTSYLKLDLPILEVKSIEPFNLSVGVSFPTGNSVRSDKIIYQDTKGMRHKYAYHKWENLLGAQLQEYFVLFFAETNVVKDIARVDNQIDPDWILEIHVSDFAQFMQDENSAFVKVSGRARLANAKTHEGISSKSFNYEIPMDGLGAKALNEAYNEALKVWTKDSLNWLVKTGEAHAR